MDAKVYKYGHPSLLPVNAIAPPSALSENHPLQHFGISCRSGEGAIDGVYFYGVTLLAELTSVSSPPALVTRCVSAGFRE